MRLSKAVAGFLLFKRVSLSESTIAGYTVALEKLQSYFPTDPDINDLTPENLTAFLLYLRDTPQEIKKGIAARDAVLLSGKSRRNIHTVLVLTFSAGLVK